LKEINLVNENSGKQFTHLKPEQAALFEYAYNCLQKGEKLNTKKFVKIPEITNSLPDNLQETLNPSWSTWGQQWWRYGAKFLKNL
jgi:hypothetical protein